MRNYTTKYNFNGLRVHHNDIIRKHLNQDYGEIEAEDVVDKLKMNYKLLPNETLYVIDCKHAQLEPLSENFNKIIGHSGPHKNDISLLYTHVGDNNYTALIRWVETMLEGMFGQWGEIEPQQDVVSCLYLSRDKKVILKSTTPIVFDSNGTMRYSLGKLTDLSELIPFQCFNYRFEGPNSQKIIDSFHKKMESFNILSPRETEILNLIGSGLSSEEIGKQLFISRLTVDKHRRNIIEKLEVKSALEAYRRCKNLGFF
ncbi:MAG: helix-turn-helix transcriptional regulator [Saprospiraceae bacterium]|nr:helix-turn-helix transcriptional regulator [Saprospiraceae bacterium]